MIVSASYVLTALMMYAAGLYLIYRLQRYLTASSMLLGILLLAHGPAYLIFMLFNGLDSKIYQRVASATDFDNIVTSLNLSIAMMFAGVIAGVELVDRLTPRRAKALRGAIAGWNAQPLTSEWYGRWLLLTLITGLALFMAWVSVTEDHIAVIAGYLTAAGDEFAKIAYRQQHGGSHLYFYRMSVNSIAPMLIIWGALAGWTLRWWALMSMSALLLALTVIGKLETLSKGPIALFLIQLLLAGYLVYQNSISKRAVCVGLAVAVIIFYPIVLVAIPNIEPIEALEFLYYRAFDISNEAMVEFFGAIPTKLPFMWGTNIHLWTRMMGYEYIPAFETVSRIWRGTGGSTTTAMFIADAWADFSYFGVIAYSIAAGVICRCIDVTLLARGKTAIAIAAMAGAFIGIYNLMISALPTAMLSGGLASVPLLAVVFLQGQKLLNKRGSDEKTESSAVDLAPGEPDCLDSHNATLR